MPGFSATSCCWSASDVVCLIGYRSLLLRDAALSFGIMLGNDALFFCARTLKKRNRDDHNHRRHESGDRLFGPSQPALPRVALASRASIRVMSGS